MFIRETVHKLLSQVTSCAKLVGWFPNIYDVVTKLKNTLWDADAVENRMELEKCWLVEDDYESLHVREDEAYVVHSFLLMPRFKSSAKANANLCIRHSIEFEALNA